MLQIINKLKKSFGQDNIESRQVAKERLQLVLTHDRISTSNNFIEKFKADIKNAVLEYVEISDNDIDVRIEKSEENGAIISKLVANIPIKNIKGRI
ncbi:MAG: cell division topological specificity factor [Candidatus Petromonas sp.]|jgi:cell division topological specificity factor|nr:cell division topological specificity factor [Candidatus Petromonas sp.]